MPPLPRPGCRLPVVALACCLLALLAAALSPPRAQAASGVLVVGDSLAVGLKPYLGSLLGDEPLWDARSGRTTPEGLFALRSALQKTRPATVIVSLGTNDGSDPARFADRLQRALTAIPHDACVVWSALSRPPRKGAFLALNRVLRDAAQRDRRLVVVDWDRAVAAGAVTLPDGLHPDANGYRYRSQMIADAVRAHCGATAAASLPLAPTGGVSG